MKLLQPLEIFFRNIRDSFRYSLKDVHRKTLRLDKPRLDDDLLLESILYAIPNSGIKRPMILNADETIKEIFTTNKNIARFGDGEIMVMNGDDIPFQKADKTLTMRLREIFVNKDKNIMVATAGSYFYPNLLEIINETNPVYKHFALYSVPPLRKIAMKYMDCDSIYYEMGINGGGNRFQAWRDFFKDKKLVLTGCKEAFDSYKFNIFDTAKELNYEFVPNKHCFSEYDNILARLKGYDKDFIHILMCGPTANILVADLTQMGFRALDLGHLAKSYDWHKRGIDMNANNGQNAEKFFSPD